MSIYTLARLRKALSSHIDIPNTHFHILKQYNGNDWLYHIRFEKQLICSLPVCSHRDEKRTLFLVGLAPNVIYPLRQIETIRILEGDVLDNMGKSWSSERATSLRGVDRTGNKNNTFLVDKETLLFNGKSPTSMLCMMNSSK